MSRVAGLSSSVSKMVKGYKHADATEARLVANMAKEGIAWRTIQKITIQIATCANHNMYANLLIFLSFWPAIGQGMHPGGDLSFT